MSCQICDNKPANCDCSSDAIRLHEENDELTQKLDSATETIKTLEFHLSEAKRDQDAILRLHDGLKHLGVEWSGSSCDAAVTELARMHAIFKAQGERHAKRCEEWAKTADEEREAKESALLQKERLSAILNDISGMAWHTVNTGNPLDPGTVINRIERSAENRVDVPECGNCGGDLVRKTEPTWICPKCEL